LIQKLKQIKLILLQKLNQKSMDVEKQIVANAERLLIQALQLLNIEPNAIEHDLIGICKKYHQI